MSLFSRDPGRPSARMGIFLAVASVLAFILPASPAPSAPVGPAGAREVAAPATPGQVPANQAATSTVGLAADPTGFDYAFYRGQDAGVYWRALRDGVWSAQSSIGGRIVGAPSATLARTTLVVAARGRNGGLYVRTSQQGTWGPWQNLGGVITAAPAVVGGEDGRIDVFARGGDNALWTRTLPPGGTWSPWRSLSGGLTSGPAAFSNGAGHVEVHVLGPDRAVWYRTRTGGSWSGWQTLGGRSYTAPAVAWDAERGITAVFVRGTSNALYLRQRTASGWSSWQNLGGLLIDAPAAAGTGGGGFDVVGRGRDNALWSRWQRNGVWSAWTRAWTPAAPAPPPSSRLGVDWTRIPTSARVVALTFDAGANADAVASIRRTLQSRNVPATFFLTGQWVRTFPAQANEVAVAGYVIGNHSDTHPELTTLTDAQVRAQVRNAEQSILYTNGVMTRPYFRFPFGNVDSRVLSLVNGLGYVGVRWTVDTLGWQGTSGGRTAQTVVNRVLSTLQPGQIVLMHVGSHPTDGSMLDAAALPQMIDAIRARGYSFVTLEALVRS